jgi:hypothetical protein
MNNGTSPDYEDRRGWCSISPRRSGRPKYASSYVGPVLPAVCRVKTANWSSKARL